MSDESEHSGNQFTPEEDQRLLELVMAAQEKAVFALGGWKDIANAIGKELRKCRERYNVYMRDDVDNRPWTVVEDDLLREKIALIGCRWSRIAPFFPGRSEIGLKNRWIRIVYRRLRDEMTSSEEEEEEEEGHEEIVLSMSEPVYMTTELDQDLKPVTGRSGMFRKGDILKFSAEDRLNHGNGK